MFPFRLLIPKNISFNIMKETLRFCKRTPDPGIGKRMKYVLGPNDNLEEFEDFEDLETDFMEVHKSHKQHMRELKTQQEKEKYLIVREKYFKEVYPNFLTWHDKEQIRYLHRSNPDEWTTENLSDSFPALPETIKKLTRSSWTKTKQNKITNHDSSVQRNWEIFKKGELQNLPPNLVEHLKKFTSRSLNLKPFQITETNANKIQVKAVKIRSTEFAEIITSYEKLKNKSSNDDEKLKNKSPDNDNKRITMKNTIKMPPSGDTYLATKAFHKKSIPLSEYRNKLEKKAESGQLGEEEKMIRQSLSSNKVEVAATIEKQESFIELSQNKYANTNNTSELSNYVKKTERDLSHLKYPERIMIPRKLFKRGFTYKLNDCYYDDDGEFLYRVPGMG